jgi:hypothetical protein
LAQTGKVEMRCRDVFGIGIEVNGMQHVPHHGFFPFLVEFFFFSL